MIDQMRNVHASQLIDWIVASLRWLGLLGMTLSLALSAALTWPAIVALLSIAAWNIFLTVLAVTDRRLTRHRLAVVGGDALAAYLLYFISGVLEGPLGWAGILPLLSASLYFQIKGALVIVVLNLIVQGVLAFLTAASVPSTLYIISIAALYITVGILISWLGEKLIRIAGQGRKGEGSPEQVERERRRAIYNLISALSATLNYERVLETALDQTAAALSDQGKTLDQLVSAVLLFKPGEKKNGDACLQVVLSRRFTPADQRTDLPGNSGLIAKTIDEGQPVLSKDIPGDPELRRVMALSTCQSAYCLPLRTGLDTYGVLLFAHPEPNFFTDGRTEILDIACHQAVIAMQNARLYQALELEKERMMEIQEDSRKKLARDLHDGPTQSVAAIAMRVNFARRLMERDAHAAADELYKIEDMARRTTKEIRHMLFTLRPLVLESQGLIPALEAMAEKLRETYNQNVIVQADARVGTDLEMSKQAVIFYIAEEAVNNARKHAKAAHVWVRLKSYRDDLVLLEIEDDGVGFDLGAVDSNYENRGSLGMVNMRERAELVNGVLRIDAVPNRGTRIQVAVPLSEEAADRLRRGQ